MAERRAGHRYAVRIIGGRWRGRRIEIPHGTEVRPTPDRARETVFNWLSGELVNARCLDLFAGTGVLGLEALSRGARDCWFVERDPTLATALRAQIAALGVSARVVQSDVAALLREAAPEPFDLVFLDAPYRVALEPLLGALEPWLAASAMVYVERPHVPGTTPLETAAAALRGAEVRKTSRAGAVVFGLLSVGRQ
jgi:16S rRNA (guanine966-N2)-methyltransferase